MKKERKVLIGIIVIVVIVVAAVLGLMRKEENGENQIGTNGNNETEVAKLTEEDYVEVLEDGSKVNTSKELHKSKEVNGLVLAGITLKETGGITKLTAQVKNNTGKKVEEKMIKIEVLNKQGGRITTLKGIIGKMEVGETVVLDISVTRDISNAYDFRIVE